MKLCIVDDAGNAHTVTEELERYLHEAPPEASPTVRAAMAADPEHPAWDAPSFELEDLLDDIRATATFARALEPRKAAAGC